MSAQHGNGAEHPHRKLERRLGLFAILTTVAISIGGIVEIAPMFSARAGPQPLDGVTPYTPLEVAPVKLPKRKVVVEPESPALPPRHIPTPF